MNRNNIKFVKFNYTLRNLIKFLSKIWSLIFLLLLIGVFSLGGVNFLTLRSIQNVALAATLVSMVAIGETLVIISGGIDLSPAYIIGLVGGIGAIVMRDMYNANFNQAFIVIVGVIFILLFSLLPGLLNGLIIAKLKVPPFIATLGVMGIAQGAAYLLNKGTPIIGLPPLVGKVGNSYLLYFIPGKGAKLFGQHIVSEGESIIGIFPLAVLIITIIALLVGFILSKTTFGHYVYAIGGNVNAARLSGIPVENILIKIYVSSSLMCGVAAIIYIIRFSVANANAGEPLLLSSIGAVFIGGASMRGGYGSISGTIIGALIIAVLQTGLVMMGVSPFWQYIAVGCIIIVAVLFDQFKYRLVQE